MTATGPQLVRPQIVRHASAEAMAEALAARMGQAITAAVAARGRAGLLLSGGTTPAAAYALLGQRSDLPWADVVLALTDERWVAPESPHANQHMLGRTLTAGAARAATLLPLYVPAASPVEGEHTISQRLETFPWPADLALYGMGSDGHTASLFPGDPRLAEALDPPAGVRALGMAAPGAGEPRLTLTLPALCDARERLLVIQGADKLVVLERALAGDDEAEQPVRALWRPGLPPLQIHVAA